MKTFWKIFGKIAGILTAVIGAPVFIVLLRGTGGLDG